MNEEVIETESEEQEESLNEQIDDQGEQQEENEQTDQVDQQEGTNDSERIDELFEFINPFEDGEKVLLIDRGESGTQLVNMITNVTFTEIFPYLIPVIFLFMLFLFSDQIIALIYKAVGANGSRRR